MSMITYYLQLLILATIIAGIIIGGIAFYLLKIKKVAAKEEKINYDRFERSDVTEFVKFDHIIDWSIGVNNEKSFGIVIINKVNFLAGIDIRGYNFHTASSEEKVRTIINSISLFNALENPVQIRQSVKAIDISYNIRKQEKYCKDLEASLAEHEQEYRETLALGDEYARKNDVVRYALVEERMRELQRIIRATDWEVKEAKEVLDYMNTMSTRGNARKINHMLFHYTFNPNDFTEELSDSEIQTKAAAQLLTMANNYISALGNCGCTCEMLSKMDMLDLMRRHNHPFSGDEFKVEKLLNSSYGALFITSDAILKQEMKRLGEQKFKETMEDMQNRVNKEHRQYKEAYQNTRDNLLESLESFMQGTKEEV